jgi:prophage antirepressor-like protein
MTQIQPFSFQDKNIRVLTDTNGDPLFVGRDICDALGYGNANQAMATHCKGIQKMDTLQTTGGKQEMRVLTEPDVMRLVVHSTLPAAQEFERLVFEEILPTIRKTGSYTAKPTSKPTSIIPVAKEFTQAFKIARMIGCDKNAAAISANNFIFQTTGTNVLSLLGQTHLEADKQALLFNVSDLMQGISGVKMNKMLAAAGMQTNEDGRWIPTEAGKQFSRVFDTGKRHSNGAPVQQIKWFREVLSVLSISEAA